MWVAERNTRTWRTPIWSPLSFGELLESDLLIVDHAGEKEPEAVLLPTLELLRGVIQQQTSVLLEHKARLKQLTAELSVRPEGALVDALMLYFSRLFAATKDTAWIEQQDRAGRIYRTTGRWYVAVSKHPVSLRRRTIDAWQVYREDNVLA